MLFRQAFILRNKMFFIFIIVTRVIRVNFFFLVDSKHAGEQRYERDIVGLIKEELNRYNPFVKKYRTASTMLNANSALNLKMRLIGNRNTDGRLYNLPSCDEVAALIVGDIDDDYNVRDIIIEKHSGKPKRINELHASYLPLQYPLLFPYGEDGYRADVLHSDISLEKTKIKNRVSMREFFAFRLMSRDIEKSTLLHASKLLQQFIVDAYTMIEAQRLQWVRTHQKELRADLYQGISDAVLRGETNGASIGERIVLPSSFTGRARYMLQNYQDAMTICRWAGYPDIFITFTCNTAWPEITRYMNRIKLKPSCRPDILSRVFKMKLASLMSVVKSEKIFGVVRAGIFHYILPIM